MSNTQFKTGEFVTSKDLPPGSSSTYRIVALVLMKNPSTRTWVQAYCYTQLRSPYEVFVREQTDFELKFELVTSAPEAP